MNPFSAREVELRMCGIVGYVGRGITIRDMISALKRLEYRGYDSAGIAYVRDLNSRSSLERFRRAGKINGLERELSETIGLDLSVKLVIAHTRWATHGKPDEINAHPHLDCSGRIAVVHNGIIENYKHLRAELESKGHKFNSDTDTEVIAHLVEEELKTSENLCKAFWHAVLKLKGAYAVALISSIEPDRIYVARNESPLIIGATEDGFFIASDIPAFLPFSRRALVLSNGQWGIVTRDDIKLYNFSGEKTEVRFELISWDMSIAEKGGYKHFMLKEIFEQPKVLRDTMEGRIFDGELNLELEELDLGKLCGEVRGITYVACGTSYHAGLVGTYFSWLLAKLPADAITASEFRYILDSDLPIGDRLFIFLSQSGETADTLAAARRLRQLYPEAKILGVTNVLGSSLYREFPSLLTRAGIEIGVAATKTFTAQLVLLLMLNIWLGRRRGVISDEFFRELYAQLQTLPKLMDSTLEIYERVFQLAERYTDSKGFLYLGRNLLYPIALEGALKLKEISYIHAEGYPAGEMKHGPIALIDKRFPSVIIMPYNRLSEKVYNNYREIVSRGGPVIVVTDNLALSEFPLSDAYVVKVPVVSELLQPILTVVPLQLFAYKVAELKGLDVDQPRNLAKSVTVE